MSCMTAIDVPTRPMVLRKVSPYTPRTLLGAALELPSIFANMSPNFPRMVVGDVRIRVTSIPAANVIMTNNAAQTVRAVTRFLRLFSSFALRAKKPRPNIVNPSNQQLMIVPRRTSDATTQCRPLAARIRPSNTRKDIEVDIAVSAMVHVSFARYAITIEPLYTRNEMSLIVIALE